MARTVVAIVDEGTDEQHPEFAGRVIAGYPPRTPGRSHDGRRSHGTNVAGVILAGGQAVTGIAPRAFLLPVAVPTLSAKVGDPSEADGLRWAADHGADVICCAWAPPSPNQDSGALPDHTRDALDHCLTHGRGGKGCVVVFSAGNDGSDLALNGYASYPGVIAVGACNAHGGHPAYSGWGEALWCVAPSNDPGDPDSRWKTYTTTAPLGSLQHGEVFYTTRFGFTSAACAVVAGICALIVAANPRLTATEVRAVLRESCDKVDVESGSYDERGHSPVYGYGRPHPVRAQQLAKRRGRRRATPIG
jgi:subtilisin family serine protease